ncbi:MAG TPA: TonB-dependent receptor, partial [Bryobacteraceae bacterium]
SYYPAPNFAGSSRYNYQTAVAGITNQDNINTRISETINAKNQVSGGFSYQRMNASNPNNIFGFNDTTAMTAENANVSWSYHFNTHLISNLRYQFSRSATNATPFFVSNNINASELAGIAGNLQAPQFYGPPTLSFSSGFTGLNDGQYSRNHNQTSAVGDNIIFIHGLHNITFGGDFRRQQFNQFAQQNPRGGFVFNGTLTGSPSVNGGVATGTGYDLADFLLGYPDTASIAYGNADKYFRASWFDLLLNDDWRISTKLSLNFGVRWDYQVPANEQYGRLVNLNIGPGFSSASPICAASFTNGLTPCPSSGALLHSDWHEFQPRFGFAYRPFPKHSTVVRGGYGIYFNTSVYQSIASQMAQQSPLSYSFSEPNTVTRLLPIQNILTQPANVAVNNTFAIDPDFRLGYSQVWQLSVQQSLKAALVATLSYNGTKGTHQTQQFLPNTYPTGAANPCPSCPAGYVYQTTGGNSSYNAASAQLQRRFRSGFSGNLMYTYAHAIDDAAGVGGRGGGGGAIAQNWLDLEAERSRSSYDQRHRFTMQMQYSTGVGTRGGTLLNGWKGTLLKDWTLTTNLSIGSGLPLTAIVPATTRGTGVTGTLRPDLTGLSLYTSTIAGSNLNPAAFAVPSAGAWGDAGRNIIEGPGQFSLNASAGRTFRLGERKNIDLRFDATNALNHVVFTSWNTTVGNAQFGFPVSANGMRTFNATLRFHF